MTSVRLFECFNGAYIAVHQAKRASSSLFMSDHERAAQRTITVGAGLTTSGAMAYSAVVDLFSSDARETTLQSADNMNDCLVSLRRCTKHKYCAAFGSATAQSYFRPFLSLL